MTRQPRTVRPAAGAAHEPDHHLDAPAFRGADPQHADDHRADLRRQRSRRHQICARRQRRKLPQGRACRRAYCGRPSATAFSPPKARAGACRGGRWRRPSRRASSRASTPRWPSVAGRLTARWRALPEGGRIDVAREMTHVTLEVLERTIFSDGLASEPATLAGAVARYLDTLGRVHPFDALDLPAFLPRIGRKRGGAEALATFNRAVEAIIARRRALLAEGKLAPRDLLTLILEAERDIGGFAPEEVRANIATFIAAGHETTANTLAWCLFLLAFAPRWRDRLEAELDEVLGEGELTREALPRLVVDQGRDRGDLAPLSARPLHHAPGDRGGQDRRRGDRQAHPRHHLALDPAPPSRALGGAGDISILRASCRVRATASTVSPICPSGQGRASASARASRCRRPSSCSPRFAGISGSISSRAMRCARCNASPCGPKDGLPMTIRRRSAR